MTFVTERRRGGDGMPIPLVHGLFFASWQGRAWRAISSSAFAVARRARLTERR
jgi:hypothetical protein